MGRHALSFANSLLVFIYQEGPLQIIWWLVTSDSFKSDILKKSDASISLCLFHFSKASWFLSCQDPGMLGSSFGRLLESTSFLKDFMLVDFWTCHSYRLKILEEHSWMESIFIDIRVYIYIYENSMLRAQVTCDWFQSHIKTYASQYSSWADLQMACTLFCVDLKDHDCPPGPALTHAVDLPMFTSID